jgi:hypothetical protein
MKLDPAVPQPLETELYKTSLKPREQKVGKASFGLFKNN